MPETKVTQPMLADAANSAVTTGEDVAGRLSTLLATIEGEGHVSLQGAAGNALQSTSQELAASLQKLLSALNSMAEAVNVSNVAYGSADSEGASSINAVGSATGDPAIVTALRG